MKLHIQYVGQDPAIANLLPLQSFDAVAANHALSCDTAVANVSQATIHKQHQAVKSLQALQAHMQAQLRDKRLPPDKRERLEQALEDANEKVVTQQKVYTEMRDYVHRLMGKLDSLRKVIIETVEKQGEGKAVRLKEKYNDMYSTYYGRDYYQVPKGR